MNRPIDILSTHSYANPDHVNGACWDSFLERFAKTEQKVSFHPSAGRDLRSLLFQAKDRLKSRLISMKDPVYSGDLPGYQTPDLWLFCGTSAEIHSFWANSSELFADSRTRIRITERATIAIAQQSIRERRTGSTPSDQSFSGLYLELEIVSDVAPLRRADVLFLQATSVELMAAFILPTRFPLSHCVVTDDETDESGTSISPSYLLNLWSKLQTEWIILGGSVYHGPQRCSPNLQSTLSDYWCRFPRGLTLWPVEHGWIRWGRGQAVVLRPIENRYRAVQVPLAALRGEDHNLPEGLYLHFCSEGWQTIGPVARVAVGEGGKVLLDEHGVRIASFAGRGWTVHAPRFGSEGWGTPIITWGPRHPHPYSGGHLITQF